MRGPCGVPRAPAAVTGIAERRSCFECETAAGYRFRFSRNAAVSDSPRAAAVSPHESQGVLPISSMTVRRSPDTWTRPAVPHALLRFQDLIDRCEHADDPQVLEQWERSTSRVNDESRAMDD